MSQAAAPTLEDVARLAGVSTASISRALNSPDKVAASTRRRIEEAIEALGYTPNFGGRALASRRTNTIGAIIPSMANAMFASGLQAFQEELATEGYTLLVATTGFDPEQEMLRVKSLVAHGADAIMLIGANRSSAIWDFIDKRRVPHVVTWCNTAREGGFFVGFDNEAAAADAARAVMDMGHRRLGLIAGQIDSNDRAKSRHDGVVRAVREYGQGARITHIVQSAYILDDAAAAFAEIMAQPETPTVILCANDAQAAGAMMAARDAGLCLPEDMSFVGFDDIGLARVVWPPLATVRVPQIDMGRGAAQMLLAILSGTQTLASRTLPTEFISRASLAPPREA